MMVDTWEIIQIALATWPERQIESWDKLHSILRNGSCPGPHFRLRVKR